jgi:hypothetical protein
MSGSDNVLYGGPGSDLDDISITFVINARGRFCIFHNRPFSGTPVWVKYLTNKKKIILVLDNGVEREIECILNEKFHKHLLNVSKAFVIRIENEAPVEGYDTTLIKE